MARRPARCAVLPPRCWSLHRSAAVPRPRCAMPPSPEAPPRFSPGMRPPPGSRSRDVVQPVLNSPSGPVHTPAVSPARSRPPQAGDSVARLHRHGSPSVPPAAALGRPAAPFGPVQVFIQRLRSPQLPESPSDPRDGHRRRACRYWAPHTGSANAKAMASYSSRWRSFSRSDQIVTHQRPATVGNSPVGSTRHPR